MGSRIWKEDIEIVKAFTGQCMECLEGLEKEILKLEIRSEDMELLNQVFQKVHSIKARSSFAGLANVTRLCRELELILEAIKDRSITVDNGLIDSLLLSVDFLNSYLRELQERLTQPVLADEGGPMFLEFEQQQNEEQVLEGLKQALVNCQVKLADPREPQETAQGEADLEILQSEEFKGELAEGLKEQFILENTEHLERIENDLLIRLDSNGDDREAIIEIFRAVHSIKGGTGIYLAALPSQSPAHSGLKKFSEVVHTFESLLALVRDRGCKFANQLIDLSYSVVDYLKSCMNSVASEEFVDLPNSDILAGIREQMEHIQTMSGHMAQKAAIATAAKQDLAKTEDMGLKSSMTQSIRVNQEKIDKMMNMISELLIAKGSFMHIAAKLNMEYDLPEISKEVKQVGAYVNRISDELQNLIMSVRMVEIKTIFQKLPRIIRDIAQSTGKKIELQMAGENTEIDKTIIEQISDPLVHLIRNAADHGIEAPNVRVSKGKPETGRIILRAYNKNRYVYIEIEDDGKGLDAERIKEKALEKGIITGADAERMSRNQLLKLIFLPGFSTAEQITEISGRGVGMDIVKSNIEKIKGSIKLESEVDKGTKFIIQLPISLAVSRGLLVEVAGESYIIPLDYISETVKINRSSIHNYNGKCFTYLRGDVIRVEWLCKVFRTGERDTEKEELNAVVISNGVENYAIVVDRLKNEQEFVVKPLEGSLAGIPGISGSTLLGNGQVILIVNPVDLLQLAEV